VFRFQFVEIQSCPFILFFELFKLGSGGLLIVNELIDGGLPFIFLLRKLLFV